MGDAICSAANSSPFSGRPRPKVRISVAMAAAGGPAEAPGASRALGALSIDAVAKILSRADARPETIILLHGNLPALDAVLDGFPFDEFHRYTGELSDDRLLYQFATVLITRYASAITPKRSGSSTATIASPLR